MKYFKMAGLCSLGAMVLMAMVGTGSASAAVLCETNQNHCAAGWNVGLNGEITFTLTSGKSAVLKAVFSEVACSNSHFKGHVDHAGGHNQPVIIHVTALSFTECKCGERTAHVTTTELGTMEVDDAGTVTSKGTRATIQCTGLASCIYGTVAGGTDIGTVTDSADTGGSAEFDASATLTWSSGTGDSGQFVCAGFGDTGTWTAEYQCTVTDDIWISTT